MFTRILFFCLTCLLAGQAAASAHDIKCSLQPGLWLKISQGEEGWSLRRVSFPPARMVVSELTLEIAGEQPVERLPLSSAVLSDAPTAAVSGPYYVHIGSRSIRDLRILRGDSEVHRWNNLVSRAESLRKERCQAEGKGIAYEMFVAWFLLRP